MRRFFLILLIFPIWLGMPTQTFSQTSTQGKDFVFSFGNVATGTPIVMLQIATSVTTTVSFVYRNNSSLNSTEVIPAGTLKSYNLTTRRTDIEAATSASNRSVEIHADEEISVYILNASSNSGDATIVLPITALGTEYYHVSYTMANGNIYDASVIVAIENGTNVFRDGTQIATNLNAGQSIRVQFARNVDGTGAHITSNHPIAYFMSNQEAQIGGASMIMEQQMPVHFWGNFFLAPIVEASERVRIVASQSNTHITYWYSTSGTAQSASISAAGGRVEFTASTANTSYYIVSDKPVSVSTYLAARPAIAYMPPLTQTVTSIVIAPFNTAGTSLSFTSHYAIVVTPTLTRDQTRYAEGTGTALSVSSWTAGAGNGNYSYAIIPLNAASSYVFKNNYGVIVWVYGLATNSSYYYVGGAATRDITDKFFIGDIGEINGEVFCFDMSIRIHAEIALPLSPQPGNLKWYINNVLQTNSIDSAEWTLPYLNNGVYTLKLEAKDAFDTVHVLQATFTQDCPLTRAFSDIIFTTPCPPTLIDVMLNDSLGMCSIGTIGVAVTSPPASGGTVFLDGSKNLIYIPPPNFLGQDSLEYTLTCGDSSASAKVHIIVTPLIQTDTLKATISASANDVCVGTSITFTTNVTNGGSSPTYQWEKNGRDIVGEIGDTYTTTTLADGDVITCEVISSELCADPPSIRTNGITMIIIPKEIPTIRITPEKK